MIDTDKYEGHTEGPWVTYENALEYHNLDTYECVVIAKEAIAEVKRLREGIEQALEAMSCHTNHPIYNSSWNILKELIE